MELPQKVGYSLMAIALATAVLATLVINLGLHLMGLEIGGGGD
jgi:hypothetical protein